MKQRNKKGFTLIELLSIIVILGVIALITVPVVSNIMKDMKKKAFKSSVDGLVESSKMYYSKKINDSDFEGNIFSFGKNEKLDGLEIKGKHPIGGEILVNVDGGIKLYVTDGEFCAFKSFESNVITITENLDCIDKPETPIINVVANKSTTNRISLVANCSYSSGDNIKIEKYEFSKDGGKTWDSKESNNKPVNYYTYANLKQSEKYEFVARCVTKVGTAAQKSIEVNLLNIDKTLIDVPDGWAREKVVTVSYPKGRYVYQYQELDSNDDVIDEDKWITVEKTESGSTHNIYQKTYIENKYIITRVLDDGGNYVDSDSILINKIDRTAPTIPTITGGSSEWSNTNIVTEASSTDMESGIAKIEYSYDNKSWADDWSKSYEDIPNGKKIKSTWVNDRSSKVYYRACDNVGNCSESSNTEIHLDKTKPTLVVVNSSGGKWTNKDVTITATASDSSLSGIKNIEYSYDQETWTTNWNDTGYSIDEKNKKEISGLWTYAQNNKVYVRATDNAGNHSEVISSDIKIDHTAPTCTWSGESTDWRTSATIKATCSDTGGSECTTDTTSKSWAYTSGTATTKTASLSYEVIDNAGNSATCSKTANIYVDRTAPAVPTLTNSSGGNWTNQGVTITTSSTDTGSGIKQIYYGYNNSDWFENWSANSSTAITNGIQIKDTWTSESTYNKTLYLRACDNVGNCSSSSNTKILIDKVAPSVPSITSSSEGKWTNQDVTITTSSTDTASGVKQIYYSYDNSNWSEGWSANSSTAITNGIQIKDTWKSSTTYNKTLYLRACDNVGNCSSSSNTKILIDKVAPSTPTITNSSGGNWTNVSITITAQATDTGSGISKFQWGYDDTPWYNWTTGTTSSITNGKKIEDKWVDEINKKLWIRAIDEAGNASTSVTTMLKLDRTAPTITMTPASGKYFKGNTVEVLCSDSTSGMKQAYLEDNGYETTGTSSTLQNLLTQGTRTATGKCTDNAGNVSTATRKYEIVEPSCTTKTHQGWTTDYCVNEMKGTCITGTVNGSNCNCQYCE